MPGRKTLLSRTPLHALALACSLSLGVRPVVAQSTTSLLPDATVVPARTLRIRGLTAWTRYDALLGDGGYRNLGALLTADSLGVASIPALAPSEDAIRAAAGNSNFRLNAGKLSAVADSRIVTAPLILEYGLSSRLTVGVIVPLVETRTSLAAGLNYRPGAANVGISGSAVVAENAAVINSMNSAASALQGTLAQCQVSPASCGLTDAQRAAARTLVQSTTNLSQALDNLYGASGNVPNQALIPLDSSAIQAAIVARVQTLRGQYVSLLGDDPIVGSPTGAHGPAANLQLQSILTALGHDTLQTIDRSSIGDITIGATYQFVNTYPDSSAQRRAGRAARAVRVAGNAAFRIGTGEPGNRNRFLDVGTGYGQPGVVVGLAADAELIGRLSASAVGSYTAQFGTVAVARLPNAGNAAFPLDFPTAGTYSAGNLLSLSLIPRFTLSGSFGLTGRYSLVHVAADTYTADTGGTAPPAAGNAAATAQQVGLGFTYASIMSHDRGPGRIPFEVSFSHLETLSARGGPFPKQFVDQIALRVYLSHFGFH